MIFYTTNTAFPAGWYTTNAFTATNTTDSTGGTSTFTAGSIVAFSPHFLSGVYFPVSSANNTLVFYDTTISTNSTGGSTAATALTNATNSVLSLSGGSTNSFVTLPIPLNFSKGIVVIPNNSNSFALFKA